jgi:predicted nuclease of predicted toxin-antitoxin system
MPQSKILIDSNVYFRLAESIHPLLKVEFGKERYCLYVIKELQAEYEKNPRLKNTFYWVNEPEYKKNRTFKLNISRKNQQEIAQVFDFIKNHAKDSHPSLSRVDITALAHAYVLDIPIVTDDSDMLDLAVEFNIKALKTLELLKLMLDCRRIDITIVRKIAAYWNYGDDKPKSFASDYKKLFKEPPPR